jgi:uncharacterized protein YheU (UPF0270 family)
VIIPYQKLSAEALRGIIEELVTRDGTELTDAEPKVREVMRQLEHGKLVITYDLETMTCNVLPAEAVQEQMAKREGLERS